MRKIVVCEHCSREIERKSDLVTALFIFFIAPYHAHCYAEKFKGIKTFFLGTKPINSLVGNFITVILCLIGLALFIFATSTLKWIGLLAFIPLGIRLLSYIWYERHLSED